MARAAKHYYPTLEAEMGRYGLNGTDLAKIVFRDPSTVSGWRCGSHPMRLDDAILIAKAINSRRIADGRNQISMQTLFDHEE